MQKIMKYDMRAIVKTKLKSSLERLYWPTIELFIKIITYGLNKKTKENIKEKNKKGLPIIMLTECL